MSSLTGYIFDAVHALAGIDPLWVALALVLHVTNLACRSVTWRNVLAGAYPTTRLSTWRVGLAYAVGCALNGYLPARGGEAVKVALVRVQHPETSAVTVASSSSVVLIFDSLVGISIMIAAWLMGALPAPPALPSFVSTLVGSPFLLGMVVTAVGAGIWYLQRRAAGPVRRAWAQVTQGVAVLRAPGRYARTVLSMQALAWCCRIGVVFALLHAFGIAASFPLAALVVVVGGLSTLVPVPGGAGTQQALAVFVLAGVTATSTALSFSIGMQVGITLVNSSIGVAAAMLVFGRMHPGAALRAAINARHHHHAHPVVFGPVVRPADYVA